MACDLCANAAEHGWWGTSGITHCVDCHRTWAGLREAHCASCHRHFSVDSAAEVHRKEGRCLSDPSLRRRGLVRVVGPRGHLWKWQATDTDRVPPWKSRQDPNGSVVTA